MQRTPCARQPQSARSQNGCDYAQSLLEHMYEALAITHLYMLVEAEGGKHNSVKDDEQEEGKIKKGEETKDGGNVVNNPNLVQRYQLSNNIESATLELDDNAQIISYEEYYPYGDTSYQAGRDASEVSQKRYRYTGKEKDEESGLYYMLARYYSGWLGRWISNDPAGLVDGVNLYMYCRGNPIIANDPSGTQTDNVTWDVPKEIQTVDDFRQWVFDNAGAYIDGDVTMERTEAENPIFNYNDTDIIIDKDARAEILAERKQQTLDVEVTELEEVTLPTIEVKADPTIIEDNIAVRDKVSVSIQTNVTEYDTNILNIPGYISSGISGFGEGVKKIGGSFRLTNGTYNGNELSIKHYESGWRGGSRAGITTYNAAKWGGIISKRAGVAGAAIGATQIGIGFYQDYQCAGYVTFGDSAKHETSKVMGGVAGSIAGAKVGILMGALFGGLGAIPGGIIGGIFGGFGGSEIGGATYRYIKK